MNSLSLLSITVVSLLAFGIFISDAYAYIDPGSGSILIQMVIAALVGVGITLKIYWVRIRSKFMSSKNKVSKE